MTKYRGELVKQFPFLFLNCAVIRSNQFKKCSLFPTERPLNAFLNTKSFYFMKQLSTLFICLLFSVVTFAQVCTPDDMYADTTGVFPPPFDMATCPDCGITDTACIGEDFNFVFTVAVGETITIVPGFPQQLDSVIVDSITGVPNGITLACNPGNCVYPANFLGCAVLSGTPTDDNAPGDYSLTIYTNVYAGGSALPIPITFPNALIAPGEYTLHLQAPGSSSCVVATEEAFEHRVAIKNVPNPTTGWTQILIDSDIRDQFDLRVMDLMGKEVYAEKVEVQIGANRVDFDGSELPAGVYIYSVGNERGVVSKKMVINRR
ncbi:MAG: T9SS C-terminal target domain-containing protein [Bacteroidetes bacterium]|nr:MAG: T9SS C-terminal target domain-containing protein [Bacteroidota bacterium]